MMSSDMVCGEQMERVVPEVGPAGSWSLATKSKERNLGLTMRAQRGQEQHQSPGCQIMTRVAQVMQGHVPFSKHTALPTPSWLNAWTDVYSLLCSVKSRRHPGL